MIKVTALTSGKHAPASRFRVRQFIRPLKHLGIEVQEFHPPWSKYRMASVPGVGMLGRLEGLRAARSSQITWLERELIPGRLSLEPWAGRRKLFDVDDAIWLLNRTGFSEKIAGLCDGVIAGNHFIADHYRQHHQRVWVVPTSIDTEVWQPAAGRAEGPRWMIGWIGSASNLPYLYEVEEALARFLNEHRQAHLRVVSDREPSFKRIPQSSWSFVRWSPEGEVGLVQEMDVGLMPLPDTDWTRGKCAFKMISYMAVGLPVVVSPVGVNSEILRLGQVGLAAATSDEWYDALSALFADRSLARAMGATGRSVVLEHYSVSRNVSRLAEIFHEVASP
ncbi:MAG TPA: glycosyltransferase family 4 protein [Pyrinomonadaceae bacterium]|jgi:glycosyltransferase involved in cell wall biosynthesis